MSGVQEILASVRAYAAADTGLIERSFAFAAERHAGQKRRSGDPYVVHPVGVARIISELRLDVPSVCAGLLHDCVEDTSATAEDRPGVDDRVRDPPWWPDQGQMRRWPPTALRCPGSLTRSYGRFGCRDCRWPALSR